MVDDDDHGGKNAGILKRSSPSSTSISTKDLQNEENIAYKERFTKLESSIKSIQMIYHNNGNIRTKNEINKSDISNSSNGNDNNITDPNNSKIMNKTFDSVYYPISLPLSLPPSIPVQSPQKNFEVFYIVAQQTVIVGTYVI